MQEQGICAWVCGCHPPTPCSRTHGSVTQCCSTICRNAQGSRRRVWLHAWHGCVALRRGFPTSRHSPNLVGLRPCSAHLSTCNQGTVECVGCSRCAHVCTRCRTCSKIHRVAACIQQGFNAGNLPVVLICAGSFVCVVYFCIKAARPPKGHWRVRTLHPLTATPDACHRAFHPECPQHSDRRPTAHLTPLPPPSHDVVGGQHTQRKCWLRRGGPKYLHTPVYAQHFAPSLLALVALLHTPPLP